MARMIHNDLGDIPPLKPKAVAPAAATSAAAPAPVPSEWGEVRGMLRDILAELTQIREALASGPVPVPVVPVPVPVTVSFGPAAPHGRAFRLEEDSPDGREVTLRRGQWLDLLDMLDDVDPMFLTHCGLEPEDIEFVRQHRAKVVL